MYPILLQHQQKNTTKATNSCTTRYQNTDIDSSKAERNVLFFYSAKIQKAILYVIILDKKEEEAKMGRLYKVNPPCPYCDEEHIYWTIKLTDEEQAILDAHTQQHRGESYLISLLSPPGLVVKRTLKCCCCKKEFDANLAIRKENEITYREADEWI